MCLFTGYQPSPIVNVSQMSTLSSGLVTYVLVQKRGMSFAEDSRSGSTRQLVQVDNLFWPHPLSSLVSLSQSLQSLTIMRKLLPIAELNPSPPIHSFLLLIFSDLGAPPLDVQYGMKQFDKAAALGHSAGSIPSNPLWGISTSPVPSVGEAHLQLHLAVPGCCLLTFSPLFV